MPRRLQSKVDQLATQVTELKEEGRQLKADLATVRTDYGGVWRWQGDGNDHPESLSCPVVMSAETLRGREEELARLRDFVAKLWDISNTEPDPIQFSRRVGLALDELEDRATGKAGT